MTYNELNQEQKQEQKENAEKLCNAIKKLAANESSLENFQWYLEYHFQAWLEKFVKNDSYNLAWEFEHFSNIQ